MNLPLYTQYLPTLSRAITAENPNGLPGKGGRASSKLGQGRKGSPCISITAGESVEIARIEGPGVIRHLWFTMPTRTAKNPFVLRNLRLRITWDSSPRAAIDVPIGDFFGCGFGETVVFSSAVMVSAPTGGLNCYLEMPFKKEARVEIVSEHEENVDGFFYQVDYSLNDKLPDNICYLHSQWRRTNGSNSLGEDHVLANITGTGCYVGTQVFLTQLERFWYGEGEVKFYIDDDKDFATIVGTGLEDYVGGAWGFRDQWEGPEDPQAVNFNSAYLGYHQQINRDNSGVSPYAKDVPTGHGMYRWHLLDPIRFSTRLKVTLQQIGDRGDHLFERRDDVTTVAYWYLTDPNGDDYSLPPKEYRRPR